MPDVKVNVPGVASGHLDYDVPGGAEFVLRQAYASYDGSGAAGSWLPALQLIGPDGNVAGTYVPGSSRAAGASADVTFAPFLGRATATAAASAGLPNVIVRTAGIFSIPTSTETTVPYDPTELGTTDSTIFGASFPSVTITAPGLYAAYAHLLNGGTTFDADAVQLNIEWTSTASVSGIEWVTPRGGANARSGFSGVQPNNDSPLTTSYIDNISWAYVAHASSSPKTLVTVTANNLSATAPFSGSSYLIVVQMQAIAAATVQGFPSFP